MPNKSNGSTPDLDAAVQRFKEAMNNEVREDLKRDRMLSDAVIDFFCLGTQGNRVSIPVRNLSGRVKDIRLYLPKRHRKGKRDPKVLPFSGGNGEPKLFPIETVQLLKLRYQRDRGHVDDEILENIGHLENLERLISDFSSIRERWTR